MVSQELQKKINASIRLLQSVGKRYDGVIEVAYSGGKDSDVILQLAKESGIRYEAIYKNTTIDPPGTIKHAMDMGAKIIRPKESFFHIVERKGLPSMFKRFCCEILKEYKVRDKSIIGIRREESSRRAKRYQEPTACRYYGAKNEKNHVEQIYPILDWTIDDVAEYVADRDIRLAPVYYDASGRLDLTRRLGCMCCPLAYYKKRQLQFKEHPKMVRAYIRAANKYIITHPNGKTAHLYKDVYMWFFRDVMCNGTEEFEATKNTLFGAMDYKSFLEDYYNVNLDYE